MADDLTTPAPKEPPAPMETVPLETVPLGTLSALHQVRELRRTHRTCKGESHSDGTVIAPRCAENC